MRPSYVVGRCYLRQRDHVVAKLFNLLTAVVLELNRDDRFKSDRQSTRIHISVTAPMTSPRRSRRTRSRQLRGESIRAANSLLRAVHLLEVLGESVGQSHLISYGRPTTFQLRQLKIPTLWTKWT